MKTRLQNRPPGPQMRIAEYKNETWQKNYKWNLWTTDENSWLQMKTLGHNKSLVQIVHKLKLWITNENPRLQMKTPDHNTGLGYKRPNYKNYKSKPQITTQTPGVQNET